jgi:hypothetical protein
VILTQNPLNFRKKLDNNSITASFISSLAPIGNVDAIQIGTQQPSTVRQNMGKRCPGDSTRIHPGRIAGRTCDHFHPRRIVVTGGSSVQRIGSANQLYQQFETGWTGDPEF